jgi:hypothetical protein
MKVVMTVSRPSRRDVTPFVLFGLAGLVAVIALVTAFIANSIYQTHSGLVAELSIPNDQHIRVISLETEWLAVLGGTVVVLVFVVAGLVILNGPRRAPKLVHFQSAPAAAPVALPGPGWEAQPPAHGGPGSGAHQAR